jgi:outer membrane protein OmpA-like peptidoglycan-associated protein
LGILKLSESMRLSCSFLAVGGMWLVMSGVALAQPLDNNSEVRVNPQPGPGRSLLYPGGEYSRSVPQLLYPGERNGPISLHMPVPHAPRRTVAKTESTAPAASPPPPKRVASLPKPAPAPKPAPKPAPQPAPQAAPGKPGQLPGIFGAPDYSNVFGGGGNAPQRQASNAPPPRTAPAGPTTGNESLTKKSMILFAKDAADPAAGALGSIKFLAGELNAAMTTPNARVELQAFGGTKGDKGSDARRLSLKRALAIRQVLIDDGVSPDRIDVRAMGGVDDTGPTDRVDVYTKA